MDKSEVSNAKGHTYMQWTLAILANMTVFTYGMQLGWVSPATKVLESTSSPAGRPLTDSEVTWLASLPPLTAMLGVLASSYLVDAYGRKVGILATAAFQAACWIIKLCPSTVTTLMIARISSGLACGSCFHVVPMYVKEISQTSIAGTLGSLVILSQNLGVLVMYALGGYLDYYTVLWIALPLPIIIFVLFVEAPESPAFLVKMGKVKEATKTLALLRGLDKKDKELLSEINIIKNEDDYFKSLPKISYLTVLQNKAWRRGFLIMLLVLWAHGYNGTFVIVTYASPLLSSSGFTMSPELQSLFVPIFMTIGSFLTVVIVDRMGRKILLTTAYIAIALALVCLATTQLVQSFGGSTLGWLPVLAMTTALFGQAIGVAPVPYIIMLEMFNFQIRAKLMGILILNIWFVSFIQLVSSELITTHLGVYTAFYWFAAVNVFGAAVVIFLMPETRGKSVEQIENELIGIKGIQENYQ